MSDEIEEMRAKLKEQEALNAHLVVMIDTAFSMMQDLVFGPKRIQSGEISADDAIKKYTALSTRYRASHEAACDAIWPEDKDAKAE